MKGWECPECAEKQERIRGLMLTLAAIIGREQVARISHRAKLSLPNASRITFHTWENPENYETCIAWTERP